MLVRFVGNVCHYEHTIRGLLNMAAINPEHTTISFDMAQSLRRANMEHITAPFSRTQFSVLVLHHLWVMDVDAISLLEMRVSTHSTRLLNVTATHLDTQFLSKLLEHYDVKILNTALRAPFSQKILTTLVL